MFEHHFDVYMALVWTMERVMDKDSRVEVYAPLPFKHNFSTIVLSIMVLCIHLKISSKP